MRFEPILRQSNVLLEGLALTLGVAAGAMALGVVLGLVAAVGLLGGVAPLRWLAQTYIEIIRNTPALVQLFVIYYGLPELGIRLPAVPSLVLALGINSGAYLAEIFRGGLQGVRRGQLEAAAAIALPQRVAFFQIVLPQATRSIWPAVTNQTIQVVLATSLGTIVGVPELFNEAMYLNSRTFRTWEILILVTLGYAALTFSISFISRLIGWRLERSYR
jgi:polar amino acid transport system permease protein